MSLSELGLIMLVTVVVFGPKKLPMLAHHIGLVARGLLRYKHAVGQVWQNLLNEQVLQDNIKKAQHVDKSYTER